MINNKSFIVKAHWQQVFNCERLLGIVFYCERSSAEDFFIVKDDWQQVFYCERLSKGVFSVKDY